MIANDRSPEPGAQPGEVDLDSIDDEMLEQAIVAQREMVRVTERAFAQLRDRFDRQRKRLRAMEDERERRRLAAAGVVLDPAAEKQVRRKRSTTGMDALLGRDRLDQNARFSAFRLLSLQRQEILLSPQGDREKQVLTFIDRNNGALLEAHTFGEARTYYEQGHALGRPGVPLQRQAVWYVAEDKSGWLRLDQMFVEQDVEDD